jgi:murein DD-endopeptidase MepM/ murein hydrolase activator NlpD/transcriptional regulator with XRE-family HTH domain
MHNLRILRDTYKLTIRGLSHITGISPYKLTRVEAGNAVLNASERAKIALVFGVPEEILNDTPPKDPRTLSPINVLLAALRRRMMLFVLLFTGMLCLGMLYPGWMKTSQANPAQYQKLPPTAQRMSITELPLSAYTITNNQTGRGGNGNGDTLRQDWALVPTVPAAVLLRATDIPTPTPSPTVAPPTPTAATVWLTAAGPYGCPLQPAGGRIVLTQGYGVGTHEPAEKWGAVDLALAAPDETTGVPIVATHSGTASVLLDSYPGGNQVSVSGGGWRTNYAHLSTVLVEHGAYVAAGMVIGLAGNTGMSSGSHLDYQVWYGATNVDPTDLVQACWE